MPIPLLLRLLHLAGRLEACLLDHLARSLPAARMVPCRPLLSALLANLLRILRGLNLLLMRQESLARKDPFHSLLGSLRWELRLPNNRRSPREQSLRPFFHLVLLEEGPVVVAQVPSGAEERPWNRTECACKEERLGARADRVERRMAAAAAAE